MSTSASHARFTGSSRGLGQTVGVLVLGAAGVAALSGRGAPVYADTSLDYGKVKEAIEKILDDDDNMGPTLVRLAWHASGTYDVDSKTGGSDGATMRFKTEAGHGANAGLGIARDKLEEVKKQFPEISYGDLWTLAGAYSIEYMGGPTIAWRPGRIDKDESFTTPDGRLPDADKGSVPATIQHLRDIFYRQGFNDQEIVALSGAHALGRCYSTRSGYDGPWTRAPTTFSNEFYRELLENAWTVKQWDGPFQFEDPTGDLMMLPSDMAMIWDKEFRKWVEIYAKDEEKWFTDFSAAFKKLEENGVKAFEKGQKKKGMFW